MTILHPNGVYRVRLRNCLCVFMGVSQTQDGDQLQYSMSFVNLQAKREVDCNVVAEITCILDQKTATFRYDGDLKIDEVANNPQEFFSKQSK